MVPESPDEPAAQAQADLTEEGPKHAGGAPIRITDEDLVGQRDGLIELFITSWGVLGWSLRTATTREQVVAAFSAAAGVHVHLRHLTTPFVRLTTSVATSADVRKARRAAAEAFQNAADFENNILRPLADRARQMQRAMQDDVAPENVHTLQSQQRAVLMKYALARLDSEMLDAEEYRLGLIRDDLEAAFAQEELTSFLARNKYAFGPRNLAYAMAGLPLIGWEQSLRRCAAIESAARESPSESDWYAPIVDRRYLAFELLEAASDESVNEFVRSLKGSILTLPQGDGWERDRRRFICGHWRALHLAVEETAAGSESPQYHAYRAFDRYLWRIAQPQSAQETALAMAEELDPA